VITFSLGSGWVLNFVVGSFLVNFKPLDFFLYKMLAENVLAQQ